MINNDGNITPGGRPNNSSENPPPKKVDLMDSGGGHSLLVTNIEPNCTGNTEGFKRSSIVVRSPPHTFRLAASASDSDLATAIMNQQKPKLTEVNHLNYFEEWQREKYARNALEHTVANYETRILELENKLKCLINKEEEASSRADANSVMSYQTDEEELARETDWILKTKKKRPTKKRKADCSPEMQSVSPKSSTGESNQAHAVPQSIKNKTNNESKKQPAPPPIMISGVATFDEIKGICPSNGGTKPKYTSYNNNVWKLNVDDSDSYRTITNELSNKKIQWYSYENKATRPIKVMARGLHPTCDENEIVQDLSDKGFKILEAKNILKKEVSTDDLERRVIKIRGLPLFMLTFDNQESADKIYSIKSILNIIVKIEPLRKNSNRIPQCKRCQAFGHTQAYCKREPACVKCAGNHLASDCTLRKEQKAKCVNCRDEHPANYRGCLVAKTQQARRNKSAISQRRRPSPRPQDKIETSVQHTKQHGKPKSYAEIVKNAREEEETSIKAMLTLILHRLDNQDKTIKSVADEVTNMKKRAINPRQTKQ